MISNSSPNSWRKQKALNERPKAEIPPEELEKMKTAIDEIKADVETAIKDQIASTRLRLEHHHTHATTWQLAKMAY